DQPCTSHVTSHSCRLEIHRSSPSLAMRPSRISHLALSQRPLPRMINAARRLAVRRMGEAPPGGTAGGDMSQDAKHPLLGRNRELEALDRLLREVRGGRSRVLVLRGEAGVGKSALLDHLAGQAAQMQTVRAAGVEAESDFAYSALQRLCAPLLSHLDRLPS